MAFGKASGKPRKPRDFSQPRKRRTLDQEGLRALAIRYVERYATTRAKLLAYMGRKLRERDWTGDAAADLEGIADRFVELGYVDDRIYGEAKARSLSARGYGAMRVEGALRQAGVDEDLREEIRDTLDARQALLAFAKRRRFGPYAREEVDADKARKEFAACMRAGHSVDLVKRLMGASDAGALETEWAEEEENF
ncbi:MAG: RecX family transcriptional regulator [Pacificimonas sp.]